MTLVQGKKIYVFGGTYNNRQFNNLFCLDLSEFRWSKVKYSGEAPSPREGHSATLISDHEIFYFGGVCQSENYNDSYVLDLEYMHWYKVLYESIYTAPSKRDSHSAVSVGNDVYIFGGIDSKD